uniref:Uncharacterized protein n=1 Tax=Spironucleus salmonicida TaxID=348837 RepID=V6LEK3_9EUKA|eukprot:EST42945.1 Hypothetical protein SS50377_17392 [Spironucleus salmonicida]
MLCPSFPRADRARSCFQRETAQQESLSPLGKALTGSLSSIFRTPASKPWAHAITAAMVIWPISITRIFCKIL